jgi:hypothetical protein
MLSSPARNNFRTPVRNAFGAAGSGGDPNDSSHTPPLWFNTSAFALPAQNTFGSTGRKVVLGPGLATIDISLNKEVTFGERVRMSFPNRFV